MLQYDTIVYGGGLYASGIAGRSILTKNYEKLKDKRVVVFTVGIASTERQEVFGPVLERNFSKQLRENIEFFHLRGRIDYGQLGFVHKAMMAMLKFSISRKDENELSDDDRELLATYGEKVDFVDKSTIAPLVSSLPDLNEQ